MTRPSPKNVALRWVTSSDYEFTLLLFPLSALLLPTLFSLKGLLVLFV